MPLHAGINRSTCLTQNSVLTVTYKMRCATVAFHVLTRWTENVKERVFAMIAKYTNGRIFSTYSSYQIQEGRSDRWRLQTNLKGTYYPTVTLNKRGGA